MTAYIVKIKLQEKNNMILEAYNNTAKPISYATVDANGNDIIKEVEFKTFKKTIKKFDCFFCGKSFNEGIEIKEAISDRFTDYAFVSAPDSQYCCEGCSLGLSLIRFSYIIDSKIRLIRQKKFGEALLKQKEKPFLVCISTSFKKHLFYKATVNYDLNNFYVNLENETILCNKEILKNDIDYISSLLNLGASLKSIYNSYIQNDIVNACGIKIYDYLEEALNRRNFQVALYLAQRNEEIKKEEAIECLKTICKI